MLTLTNLTQNGYERVCAFADETAGLKGFVAIHSTARGPAAGGCRYWHYDNEQDALADALRLARGMSFKNATANLPLGGAKAVIMAPQQADRPALFRAFGKMVQELGGQYVTAEDVGTSVADMQTVAAETKYVSGITGGDPSPWTAKGVFLSLQQAVRVRLGRADLKGLKVAVQGVGHVGNALCGFLHEAGAELIVADTNTAAIEAAVKAYGANAVAVKDIAGVSCDVYAPCALGHAINPDTLARLKAPVVCGAANNQLASAAMGDGLHAKNILYAPDYVANGGGIISVAAEYLSWPETEVAPRVNAIADTIANVFTVAARTGRASYIVADELAEAGLKPVK